MINCRSKVHRTRVNRAGPGETGRSAMLPACWQTQTVRQAHTQIAGFCTIELTLMTQDRRDSQMTHQYRFNLLFFCIVSSMLTSLSTCGYVEYGIQQLPLEREGECISLGSNVLVSTIEFISDVLEGFVHSDVSLLNKTWRSTKCEDTLTADDSKYFKSSSLAKLSASRDDTAARLSSLQKIMW